MARETGQIMPLRDITCPETSFPGGALSDCVISFPMSVASPGHTFPLPLSLVPLTSWQEPLAARWCPVADPG